ncbi:hypothetical protein H4R20_003324 [Coemansia guatemalensis]|uniref:Uncharacterized protein n=1 Tax=Coemansia guatemalensis TaxID=2761395 RepID=A0A9W8HVV1_9FUNG|nr:hypothetical protein H4R20_003324 [Coemansia guatemalensis]
MTTRNGTGSGSGKRAASSSAGSVAPRETAKRARKTLIGHVSDCADSDCAGCADGGIALGQDVANLSASELSAMAEQEDAAGTDRAVVNKLYETALEKFAGERSLAHAWTLLRLAESVDFNEYATQASAMVDKIDTADNKEKAQALVIRGRARVVAVCLDQANWRDPLNDDSDESDGGDDEAAKIGGSSDNSLRKRISGEQSLIQGLDEIADGLKLLDKDSIAMTAGTVAFFTTRHERRLLTRGLRLKIMDSALQIAYSSLGWDTQRNAETSNSASDKPNAEFDLSVAACKAAVYWALAAADCKIQGSRIEARVEPATRFLETASSDAECCKLRAQILIALSTVLDEEDAAVEAFESAVEALQQAHRISPNDKDVINQLEDLGVDVEV